MKHTKTLIGTKIKTSNSSFTVQRAQSIRTEHDRQAQNVVSQLSSGSSYHCSWTTVSVACVARGVCARLQQGFIKG